MSNDVIKDDQLNHILVEGQDDYHAISHLLRFYNLDTQVTIQPKEGIDNLLESLEVELMRRAETRLGIVVDADIDISSRWQSLSHRLLRSGYGDIPPQPNPKGTILKQAERPLVGVWLMPNNTISGMLEDFMSLLIPSGDTLWPIAQDIVEQVITKDRRFPQTQEMKANIHTWLAWQEEPGKPMGQAITKRYLDAAAFHAQQFILWIRRLFDLETV